MVRSEFAILGNSESVSAVGPVIRTRWPLVFPVILYYATQAGRIITTYVFKKKTDVVAKVRNENSNLSA